MILLPRFAVFLFFSLGIQAERVFDELIFTKEKCVELGVADEFEECAVLEFCTAEEDDDRHNRQRALIEEGDPVDMTVEDAALNSNTNYNAFVMNPEENFAMEVKEAEEKSISELSEIDLLRPNLDSDNGNGPVSSPVSAPTNDNDDDAEDDIHETNTEIDVAASTTETSESVPKSTPEDQSSPETTTNVDQSTPEETTNVDQSTPETLTSVDQSVPEETTTNVAESTPDETKAAAAMGIDNGPAAKSGYRVSGSSGQCTYPGPIIRLKRGVKHGLFLKGGSEETNLHLHGLHIKGYGNGDNNHRFVKGSDNMLVYDIDLPADQHMGGTHWYHSHIHGNTWEQVQGGAFGMIIIDDNGHPVGTEDANVLEFLRTSKHEKVLIIDDSKKSNSYTANGMESEVLEFVQNQWYRLRILTVGVDAHTSGINVVFDDYDADACHIHAMAHDGIFRFEVPRPHTVKEYPLTTASRLDVAIRCKQDIVIKVNGQQIVEVRTSEEEEAEEGTPYPGGSTASWKSARLEYTKNLTSENAEETMKLRVDETNINGVSQASHKPMCNKNTKGDFQYGTIQEWKFSGVNTHPFHVHVYPMQVVSDGCGPNHDKGEFYDTILAPESSISKPCIVRLYFVDIYGPTTVHCHIYEHAKHGAITWFNVIKDDDANPVDEVGATSCQGQCTEPTEPPALCSSRRNLLRANY